MPETPHMVLDELPVHPCPTCKIHQRCHYSSTPYHLWCTTCGEHINTYKQISPTPPCPPKHYQLGKYKVADVISDWSLSFAEGNIIKYVVRAGRKGARIDDLLKAEWYLAEEIKRSKQENK